ncbi:MAG: cytochrome c [Lentilitoribacter sp.]
MKFLRKIKTVSAIAGISVMMMVGPQAIAMDDPDAIVKERQVVMDNVKNTVGALSKAVKSGASTEDILAAADAFLAATASSVTVEAFKTNTHGKSTVKTTATEKVWTDWARFEQALLDMESGAKEIQVAAAAGTLTSDDQLGVALKECGFCHRSAGYRAR